MGRVPVDVPRVWLRARGSYAVSRPAGPRGLLLFQTGYAEGFVSVTSLCNRVAVLVANPGVRADRPRRAVISQILREFTLISAIRR